MTMKHSDESLLALCPDIDPEFVRLHTESLGSRYFDVFSGEETAHHIRDLARLSPERPVVVHIKRESSSRIACTVLGFDYPGEFSLITGILTGLGLNILSGDIFTYKEKDKRKTKKGKGKRQGGRRRIIDCFSGSIDSSLSFESWAESCAENLTAVIGSLEKGDDASLAEAKQTVNELVAGRLAELDLDSERILMPVHIETGTDTGPFTRLKVFSEDTPGFLYALSTAFSLKGINIERVHIRTFEQRIEDEFDLSDSGHNSIQDPALLNQIKLSVLLTKQFTYFLGRSPDPYTALSRFEHLAAEVLSLPEQGRWMDLLSKPAMMQELARLLGTSDFMWEDFIRLQYETLLPMIEPHLEDRCYAHPPETLKTRIAEELDGAGSFEERCARLNEFKDREMFLIDLDHILNPESDFKTLSNRLTVLAQEVIRQALAIVYEHLAEKYGRPRTVAGYDARFAVFGLGKCGGAALGYGSDIELLFVYSDSGSTDGDSPIRNAEFFNICAREISRSITARRKRTFTIDLRLRPYGKDGPLACSLETFCSYYSREGDAHSYERLALVRLRALAGDREFGLQIERLRDEIIYGSDSVDREELRDLREKQFREKISQGRLNAKFSPGALVDLEYDVQILQVTYGRDRPELRTPEIHKALTALMETGVLCSEEASRLTDSYDFFRRCINGLRMLRGSADDTFLPEQDSDEYEHLARRMGYARAAGIGPGRQLYVDFETHSAQVRTFIEHHFGREALPGSAGGNVADVILSDNISGELRRAILTQAGFTDPERASVNFSSLAGQEKTKGLFARLAVLAVDILRRGPDPDTALNNWERFVRSVPDPHTHYALILSQPTRADILLRLFAVSQFLSDTLVQHPEYVDILTSPEQIHRQYSREDIEQELRDISRSDQDHDGWLNRLREMRRREILRIGTRDLCLQKPVREITRDISLLAEASIQIALERILEELKPEGAARQRYRSLCGAFCILALGKLGGSELNYSSDIDLAAVYDEEYLKHEDPEMYRAFYTSVLERLRSDLSAHTEQGLAYRVDFRLRPYGASGALINSVNGFVSYYEKQASLWEIQALLKLRPVAGNITVGRRMKDLLKPVLYREHSPDDVTGSIRRLRREAVESITAAKEGTDVKNGRGGLRDIEFLVQGLQLIHASAHPDIISENTLDALALLGTGGIIGEETSGTLSNHYAFLRRVEHFLQIQEDRQTHSVPGDPDQRAALARRISGPDTTAEEFSQKLESCMQHVHDAYVQILGEYRGKSGLLGKS